MTTTEKPTPRTAAERLLEAAEEATGGTWAVNPYPDDDGVVRTDIGRGRAPIVLRLPNNGGNRADLVLAQVARTLAPAVARALVKVLPVVKECADLRCTGWPCRNWPMHEKPVDVLCPPCQARAVLAEIGEG